MCIRTLSVVTTFLIFFGVIQAQEQKEQLQGIKKITADFQNYRVRFRMSMWESATTAESYKQVPNDKIPSANCMFIKYAEDEIYIQDGGFKIEGNKAKPVIGGEGTKMVAVDGIRSFNFIASKLSTGIFDGNLKQLGLYKDVRLDDRDGPCTPVDMPFGHNRIYTLAEFSKDKTLFLIMSLDNRPFQGMEMTRTRIEDIDRKLTYDLWFDGHISRIPRYIETREGSALTGKYYIANFREVEAGKWVPDEVTVEYLLPKSKSMLTFIKIQSVELLTSKPKDFSISLPAGTAITDSMAKKSFRLQQDEAISPEDLPELLAKTISIEPRTIQSRAIEHTASRSSLWFWILGCLGLLLVGYGGYRWFRSRKRV